MLCSVLPLRVVLSHSMSAYFVPQIALY
jgi:hypothetical protein